MKKTGSAEIEYSNDEYTATCTVKFEKEDAEFIYVLRQKPYTYITVSRC